MAGGKLEITTCDCLSPSVFAGYLPPPRPLPPPATSPPKVSASPGGRGSRPASAAQGAPAPAGPAAAGRARRPRGGNGARAAPAAGGRDLRPGSAGMFSLCVPNCPPGASSRLLSGLLAVPSTAAPEQLPGWGRRIPVSQAPGHPTPQAHSTSLLHIRGHEHTPATAARPALPLAPPGPSRPPHPPAKAQQQKGGEALRAAPHSPGPAGSRPVLSTKNQLTCGPTFVTKR